MGEFWVRLRSNLTLLQNLALAPPIWHRFQHTSVPKSISRSGKKKILLEPVGVRKQAPVLKKSQNFGLNKNRFYKTLKIGTGFVIKSVPQKNFGHRFFLKNQCYKPIIYSTGFYKQNRFPKLFFAPIVLKNRCYKSGAEK